MNPIKKKFKDIKNTRKNWKKVQASPYARLELALKAKKLIIGLLIPYLIYMTYKMVVGMSGSGFMGVFTKLVSIGIMSYVCWRIYKTIPQAKKQIEYYKKYPHTINYCPTNTKETIDDIFKNIEKNKESIKSNKEVKNGTRKKTKRSKGS